MKFRLALAGAAVAAIALTGCAAAEPESSDPRVTPQQTAGPTSEPSASPEPTGPPPLSCNTIITQETIDGFEAAGYIHEVDYESQVRSEGGAEELFFDYGGLACMWFLPNSDGWFTAAFSELTEQQSAEAQARLVAEGFVRSDDGTDVIYSLPAETDPQGGDTYLFEPGAWYHSNHPDGVAEVRSVVSTNG